MKRNIQHRGVKSIFFQSLNTSSKDFRQAFVSPVAQQLWGQLLQTHVTKINSLHPVSAVYTENLSNNLYEIPLQQGSDIWITSSSSGSMLELASFAHFWPLPQAMNVFLLRRTVLLEGQGDALLQPRVCTFSWEWGCEHQPLLKEIFKEALKNTTFTNTCHNLESNSLLKTRIKWIGMQVIYSLRGIFSVYGVRKKRSPSCLGVFWFGVVFFSEGWRLLGFFAVLFVSYFIGWFGVGFLFLWFGFLFV